MKQVYVLVDGELHAFGGNGTSSIFNKESNGLVPAPNSDSEMYLQSDGTWTEIDSIPMDNIKKLF